MLAAMPPLSTPSSRTGEAPARTRGDACPGALRLHRADDGFLARLRLPGGVLTVRQAEVLGTAAERLGDGSLSVTSRGNAELRGLDGGCGAELAALLHEAGLLPSERHERVRNIVASPAAGLDRLGFADAQLWARELDALLCAEDWTAALSGRFLFALDDGRGDVRTLGADVSLLATPADEALVQAGNRSFRIPATAAPRAALAAARAFLTAAETAGNGAWRVRDLPPGQEPPLGECLRAAGIPARAVEGAGAAAGSGAVDEDGAVHEDGPAYEVGPYGNGSEYGNGSAYEDGSAYGNGSEAVACGSGPAAAVHEAQAPGAASAGPLPGILEAADGSCTVVAGVPFGRLGPAQWRALLSAPARELRLTPWRSVLVPGLTRREAGERLAALAAAGLTTAPDSPWLHVGACTGRPGCGKSRADVRAEALPAPGRGLPVYWSGCERRCGHPAGDFVDVLARAEGAYEVSVRRSGLPDLRCTVPETEDGLRGAITSVRTVRRSAPPPRTPAPRTPAAASRTPAAAPPPPTPPGPRAEDRGFEMSESTVFEYEKDGAEIYRRSFATIRAEADLAGLPEDVGRVAVRMIHACGMTDLVADLAHSPRVVARAREALRAGAPILCDAQMVASGVTRRRLPADNEVLCTLSAPEVPSLAAELGTTRSAAALELWRERLDGAVVAVGNAPTALFRLLEMIAEGAPRPAAVIGVPVGFIGAAESKDALAASPLGLEYLVVRGRRGGSAMAAAALNAIASEQE